MWQNTVSGRNNSPKVSVCVITYNQRNTIRQTLDSILCQEGDFDLEVVIGEDHSNDGTRVICEGYASKYPKGNRVWINLLPDEPNLGIVRNFARVMKRCDGDYVAICAGDDYWCDEYKVQKQIEYFVTHPDYEVVSTSGYKFLVKENKFIPDAVAPFHPVTDGNIKQFYFSSSYSGGVYAMPLSLLIKKEALVYVDFDEFVRRNFPVEDYPMQAVMSQHCRWGHIPDLTVVYRVYKESSTFISVENPRYMTYHRGLMNVRRYLNELFPADACFSENDLVGYEFYKEFLLFLHQFRFNRARQLVKDYSLTLAGTDKYIQACRVSKTMFHFVIFAIYKELRRKMDLIKRT